MADANSAVDEKEKKRRKQAKKMGKTLAACWNLKGSEGFQEERHSTSKEEHVLDLATIGQKLDAKKYRLGRHGWEDFARDLGGVYNRHTARKTKHAKAAASHLKEVQAMLKQKDPSLADIANNFVPTETAAGNKKRKASDDVDSSRIVRKRSSTSGGGKSAHALAAESGDADLSLKDREVKAMEQLAIFVEENGGSREVVAGFRSRVTRKPSDRRYDVTYYNEEGRRFRSMLEVGRFFSLVKTDKPPKRKPTFRSNKPKSSREKEAEKKKLRKELERLRKAHQRATKALDDFVNDQKESTYPMEDLDLMSEEVKNNGKQLVTASTCAAARIPDIRDFPGIPQHCVPDLLMTWDFLCTFSKTLNLEQIGLEDFVGALTYKPPEGAGGDDIQAPPVFLAEAHLGLLKLLVSDRQSDEWWWAILETQETENPNAKLIAVEGKEEGGGDMAVIKVDLAGLLSEEEDPLMTNSWLASLEEIGKIDVAEKDTIKNTIKTALAVVGNKYVAAYMRKVLSLLKRKEVASAKNAVAWLLKKVQEARPDLNSRSVRESKMAEIRKKVVDEAQLQMQKLGSTAPAIKAEDLGSDVDESDDEDSDDSDDEDMGSSEKQEREPKVDTKDDSELPAPAIPLRPSPTLVDLLLPPFKPHFNSEFLNSFSWPQMAAATVCRVLHRFKRLRNEVDDSLRAVRELTQVVVSQRREREAHAVSRVFTECLATVDNESPSEMAVEHLCSGGDYLDLSPVQRLCILRVLVEAAYDTHTVSDVVDGNFKQRISASKTVDAEERKAKKEEKENKAAAEASGREQLAFEARERFLEEKRAEIRKINEGSNEFTDEFMDSLTDEDIIDFDEDIKADFNSLPAPESFSKIEVNKMVVKMHEAAAFDTHSLKAITMDELLQQEKEDMKAMEEQLASFGDSPDNVESGLDRETSRSIERLRKNIEKTKEAAHKLPAERNVAILILRDAIADGTQKLLKGALREAKAARLSGEDETTGGMWALDLMRDAALELEKAKQLKRVADARKELVAKRNKCFIRNEPLGLDRFRNRFWHFDRDEDSHFWVEAALVPKQVGSTTEVPEGFVDLTADAASIFIGARDEEEDLLGKTASEQFRKFSRQEYHSSALQPCLAKKNWGCHATEKSIRTLIKNMDSRGIRENELKSNLKESLEESAGEKHDGVKEEDTLLIIGDEEAFKKLRDMERESPRDGVVMETLDTFNSCIGASVRVRIPPGGGAKDSVKARYETGKITGFKTRHESSEVDPESMDEGSDTEVAEFHEWQAVTDRGRTHWLSTAELMESLCRFVKWNSKDTGYFELDTVYLAYRNSIGRHCGKAADAPYSNSPMFFARMMVRREQELYSKLKNRNYDNNWGGKSGARAVWTNSMKDYTFDLKQAREGLLTLENAFNELMDGIPNEEAEGNGKELLENPTTRDDIELESIDSKSIISLWNSPNSRAVFYEIVNTCRTTGFLALAFDLLCRNTTAYLSAHKLLNVKTEPTYSSQPMRTTRRMNAWQQQQAENADSDWE